MNKSATGAPAASILAGFAAELTDTSIPPAAFERATHCLVDAVGCALFGGRFSWSQIALSQTSLDPSRTPLPVAAGDRAGDIREAALVWGTRAHAFELDSLCRPSAGVHPGATVALPALAMAHALGAPGRDLLRAIVAGCEVMFRIGTSTLHSPERRGFHAPGLNGPFGAAVACGVLLGFSRDQFINALGIAGSLGSGLLAFSRAERGGMVKRLHMGRAAEGGVLAAQLAAGGFDGPDTVLDGTFGFLQAVTDDNDPSLLTTGLGTEWKITSLCLKLFPIHITAHAPVYLLRTLMEQNRFAGDDIATLRMGVSEKVLSHHTGRAPHDVMQAQYSVPYCVAISAYRGLDDPHTLTEDVVTDPRIRALAGRIVLEPKRDGNTKGWGIDMTVTLHDGRRFDEVFDDFPGCPASPFSTDQLHRKFRALSRHTGSPSEEVFENLLTIVDSDNVRQLWN